MNRTYELRSIEGMRSIGWGWGDIKKAAKKTSKYAKKGVKKVVTRKNVSKALKKAAPAIAAAGSSYGVNPAVTMKIIDQTAGIVEKSGKKPVVAKSAAAVGMPPAIIAMIQKGMDMAAAQAQAQAQPAPSSDQVIDDPVSSQTIPPIGIILIVAAIGLMLAGEKR